MPKACQGSKTHKGATWEEHLFWMVKGRDPIDCDECDKWWGSKKPTDAELELKDTWDRIYFMREIEDVLKKRLCKHNGNSICSKEQVINNRDPRI